MSLIKTSQTTLNPSGIVTDRPLVEPPRMVDSLSLAGASSVATKSEVNEANSSLPPRVDGKYFVRAGQRFRVQGVTYGPFAPNEAGEQFPSSERVQGDFEQMRRIGVNSIRTYHVPPQWFLDIADAWDIAVFVDVPWPKHLCFLDSKEAQKHARDAVRRAAERGSGHTSLFAYSIGNEIPSDIVRWHGAKRVERFLAELVDVARQADPTSLLTYATYPSTEYLDLSFLDFSTFNVYLHDVEAFRRYLFRLQNMTGDKPLLLGELGMDTRSHSENEQAEFLRGHLREATLMGLAGTFIFSWTDDWFTGGFQIEDWEFGITRRDRSPKEACIAVESIYKGSPSTLLEQTPRVSVVVCSYNGGATLDQCLRSLLALDYPDYEIILVDDGSTDDTREIVTRFPTVRTIHQENQGLSVARNVGLEAATGSIVAYTDSDCFADSQWLTQLVYQLQRSGASAVGGPNLTPDDGALAACVAASPGQPTHVLETDQVAEHIPGCNMAFIREALLAINGFIPTYRKAGDDVDACWRLLKNGGWITFAPGAFVWHHRRQTPRTYLRQQAGYGEAEALLWFEHPERFNSRGEGRWRGSMYGGAAPGLRFGEPIIYRGVFSTGLFQTLYQPAVAHWATIPSTLEWHILALASLAFVSVYKFFWAVTLGMLCLSVLVAIFRAVQAHLPAQYRSLSARLLIAALSYIQPLVRSWSRYRTRFFPPSVLQPQVRSWRRRHSRKRSRHSSQQQMQASALRFYMPLSSERIVEYWDEEWRDRTALLEAALACMLERRLVVRLDSGWSSYDFDILPHPWTYVRLCTVQEDHGSGRRLFRLRYQLHPRIFAKVLFALTFCLVALASSVNGTVALILAASLVFVSLALWARGAFLASEVMAAIEAEAIDMDLIRCVDSAPPEEQRS